MKKFWEKKPDALEVEIESIEKMLNDAENVCCDEYSNLLDRYERLCALRDQRKKPKIEPDTWAKIISNLMAILMVMNFERLHIITTKAWGFVTKPRI